MRHDSAGRVTVGSHFYLRPRPTSHILCSSPHFQVGHFAHLATAADRFSAPAARRYPWWQVAVLVVLVAWLYSSILYHLVGQWWQDPNFSHGFFVPLFSAFVLWQDRSRLASISVVPSSWGLLIVLGGLSTLILGVLGAELFLSRFSLLLLIAGLAVADAVRALGVHPAIKWPNDVLVAPNGNPTTAHRSIG